MTSKPTLLLLTFFLGGIGAHKFYLGKYVQAGLYLLFWWTLVPVAVALVEFVIYALTSPARLNEKFSAKRSIPAVLLFAVCVIAAYAALLSTAISARREFEIRAKAQEGLVLAGNLKQAIADEFADRGPADMSCAPERCAFTAPPLGPAPYVRRISSDRTGVITVEYPESLVPAPGNRIAITPLIDGKPADLSSPTSAGKSLTWQCGQNAATTIAERYLPRSCRRAD